MLTFCMNKSIWKNWRISFKEHYNPKLANWPEWLVERLVCIIPPSIVADLVDMALDMPRSIFSNVFSRKLPQWGNVNEKIKWVDLTKPTICNILALNAFAHHDIVTLPIGINQTITTETLDVIEDATSRLPKIGDLFNSVIKGFHNLIFGKSPSGFKRMDYN